MKSLFVKILLFVLFVVLILFLKFSNSKYLFKDSNLGVNLLGEVHGSEKCYDIEFREWNRFYKEGCRDLFIELPYYSAEFLNEWMKEDSDYLIDILFNELEGTLASNDYYYEFLQKIKDYCPETIFHGTDIGHQYTSTGARYLAYLELKGLLNSKKYILAKENIEQGKAYYSTNLDEIEKESLREEYMIENFISIYSECDGRILGIYGKDHLDLSDASSMASKLKNYYEMNVALIK